MSSEPTRSDLPAWLVPIREGTHTISAAELSRFEPPEDARTRPGAVLMLFGESEAGPDLLLTERAHHMRSHPGQISFPGGGLEPHDDGPVAAALREAQEEVGLDPAGVEVLGTLPELWLPPSNFAVTTVVGWWHRRSPVGVVDPDEVAQVVHAPLEDLLDSAHRFTVVHPSGFRGPGFAVGARKELLLWGFTAGLVSRLLDHVGLTRPWDTTVEREVSEPQARVGQDDPR